MAKKHPTTTVKQLRNALALLDGDIPVRVWLPGSTIALEPLPFMSEKYGCVLIEGNVDPGSALSDQ